MKLADQSQKLSQEFFEIMLLQKQVEKRLRALRSSGAQFRVAAGAPASAGHGALVQLELAEDHATQALDAMASACAAAKPDAIEAGTPFECPAAIVHRPTKARAEVAKAA